VNRTFQVQVKDGKGRGLPALGLDRDFEAVNDTRVAIRNASEDASRYATHLRAKGYRADIWDTQNNSLSPLFRI